MTNAPEDIVGGLVATRKWSADNAKLTVDAKFRCEYCGLDFLASLANYKLWQVDHIIPVSCGGSQKEDNLAIACRPCNWDFKSRWDPRRVAGENAGREALIQAVRDHIQTRRLAAEEDLAKVRSIVGYNSDAASR